jgi:glycerol kinase
MAYQSRDLIDAMAADSGQKLKDLRVDGGASMNDALMQFQADITGVNVQRPMVAETTALGAAYLAGLAVGFWKDMSDVTTNWALDKEFKPNMKQADRKKAYAGWKKAVERSRHWAE